MSLLPSAQLTIQTLFVLLKHGFVTMSRTVRYVLLITPLLDVIEIGVVVGLLFSFITVSGTTNL